MGGPVFGKESVAASAEPLLRWSGDSAAATWRIEGASTDWCTLRAASATGVRHRLAGQGGEDSFAWRHDGDFLALAVADGLGSSAGSGAASLRAATAAAEVAVASGPKGLSEALVTALEAADRSVSTGAGATTLVVALLDRQGGLAVARVGDSTAFLVKTDTSWTEIFDPPDGDRVGTETVALPVAAVADLALPAVTELTETSLPAGDVLVLATDGVGDPWRDGPTTVAPALAEAVLGVPSPLELARLVDFSRQGCHDDRTLACLWWRG